MLIQDFIHYILKEKRYSPHTVVGYEKDLMDFHFFCKSEFSCELIDVKSKIVRSWFSSLMESGMEPRSIRRKSSSLKSFYKYLLKNGHLSISPLEGVPLPKLHKKLPGFVEESGMILFEDIVFEDNFTGKMERLVIELFYHTGIRLSELINIKISDIEFSNATLKVLGKRNKERLIPFSLDLSETIEMYLPYRNTSTEYLFVTEKGMKTYPKLIYRIVQKYLQKITTLTKKSPHVLRHTFATHMLNNGAELNAIKEILGHASLSATEVYTHNSLEKIKLVYKQAHPRA